VADLDPRSLRAEMTTHSCGVRGGARLAGGIFPGLVVVSQPCLERTATMMLGMSLSTFTTVHVIISLVGIVTGFIVLFGMLSAKRLDGWTGLFLLTTVLTSVTAFGFPFTHLLPSHIVAIISLVILAIALLARYSFHMAGAWRVIYVVTAMIALYLNVFVLVVQSFEKVPALHVMAPTQTESPFKVAQLVVLVLFIVLTIFAAKKFHPDPVR
jgi:hypothetical protein